MDKKIILRMIVILAAVGFIIGMFLGHYISKPGTVVIDSVKCDTIVKIDTVLIDQPVVKDSVIVKYITRYVKTASDDINVAEDMPPDSVNVELPITQKVYEDSLYKAYVSGYEAQLDSINIYQNTEYITKTITIEKKRSRWGAMVGLGVGVNTKNISPYVGIMVGYKLF